MSEVTEIFFSLSFSPYLLQIDFPHEIDPMKIKVKLEKGHVKMTFVKVCVVPLLEILSFILFGNFRGKKFYGKIFKNKVQNQKF